MLSNDQDFSFERGTARVLNLGFIIPLSKGKFSKDVHMMVAGGIIPRMEKIVDQSKDLDSTVIATAFDLSL